MKGQKVLFNQKNDDWETPQNLFDELNEEFNFCVDLAASEENAKIKPFISDIKTVGKDFIVGHLDGYVWCNPPSSNQRKFVEFVIKHKLNSVFLLPARTDTKLFHELIYPFWTINGVKNLMDNISFTTEVRFIEGRLKFGDIKNFAPFPLMIVIFRFNNE